MAGISDNARDNVREASHGLARGKCHWVMAVAELSFVALSKARGRSSGAEILRCARIDGYMWLLCNRPAVAPIAVDKKSAENYTAKTIL